MKHIGLQKLIHILIYLRPLSSSEKWFAGTSVETQSVLVENKPQDQTLCLATRHRDFLFEFVFFCV